MEVLQVAQYYYIDQCSLPLNQFLTVLGLLHIAFQPCFSNLALYGLSKNRLEDQEEAKYAIKLSFLAGCALFARWVFADYAIFPFPNGPNATNEWMVGPRTCSFTGPTHVGWELTMIEVSYFAPSFFIHLFCMFAPVLLMSLKSKFHFLKFGSCGAFLFVTGPVLAAYITGDRFEQPAVWCFFSVSQLVLIMA